MYDIFTSLSLKFYPNFTQCLRDFNIFHIKINPKVGFAARKYAEMREPTPTEKKLIF